MIAAVSNDLPANEAVPTKVCSHCGDELPLPAFRADRDRPDGRRPECRRCRSECDRARTIKKKRQAIGKANAALNRARRSTDDVKRIAAIARGLIAHFRGVHRLVDFWAGEFEALSAKSPGSKWALKSYAAIASLIHLASPERTRDDFDDLTDEDLAREYEIAVLSTIDDSQELVAARLRSHGWTVTPPADRTAADTR